MSWLPESDDHRPLTWWKGQPIYLSGFLALAGVASIIFSGLLIGIARNSWISLAFSYEALLQLHLWTPFSYIFLNPPVDTGSVIWGVIGCIMLWRFGEMVERHLGLRSYIWLLMLLLLVNPLLVTIAGLLGLPRIYFGMSEWGLGVFIAFAALYPRLPISLFFVSLMTWVCAAVLVAIRVLVCVTHNDWVLLLVVLGQVGTAFAYIRYEQGALKFPVMPAFAPLRPVPKNRERDVSPAAKPKKRSPQVDDILDKISREGMHSLTPDERRILDQASEDLQKRKR